MAHTSIVLFLTQKGEELALETYRWDSSVPHMEFTQSCPCGKTWEALDKESYSRRLAANRRDCPPPQVESWMLIFLYISTVVGFLQQNCLKPNFCFVFALEYKTECAEDGLPEIPVLIISMTNSSRSRGFPRYMQAVIKIAPVSSRKIRFDGAKVPLIAAPHLQVLSDGQLARDITRQKPAQNQM